MEANRGSCQSRRGLVAAAVLSLVAVLASSCAFVEPQRKAADVVSAPAKARELGTATGTLSISAAPSVSRRSIRRGPSESEMLAGLHEALRTAAMRNVPVELDFAGERAALGDEASEMLFDGVAVYMRRGGDDVRRPWAMLDFGALDLRQRVDENPPMGIVPINPVFVAEFISGALAGSVEEVRREFLHGVEVTRYEVSLDWEKALDDAFRSRAGLPEWSDERLEAFEMIWRVLRLQPMMGVDQSSGGDPSALERVQPAEVWVDGDGLPRKLEWTLEQSVLVVGELGGGAGAPGQQAPGAGGPQQRTLEVTITLDLREFGSPVEIEVPDAGQVLETDRFGELVREATMARGMPGGLEGSPEGLEQLSPDELPQDIPDDVPEGPQQ